MAKESMKAREVKRAKLVAKYAAKRQATGLLSTSFLRIQLRAVCTTAVLSPDVQKDICASSASAVSSSVRWQATVLSQASRRQAGNILQGNIY